MERIQIISNHLTSGKTQDTSSTSSFDYYQLDDLLNDNDKDIRYKIKSFVDNELNKININEYYEKAEFPFEVLEKLSKLNLVGSTMKGYGCSNITPTSLGLIGMELAKSSADLATFYAILLNITMLGIYYCGSEQQKEKYLPDLASMKKIGAFALTEPNAGSDAAGLQCKAKKVDGGWLLTGEKRWIGNAPFADVIVVWARNVDTNKIHGFIVEPKTVNQKGCRIETIKNKIALRSVQNGHIYFDNCFIREDQRLPLANDFNSGPGRCLFLTRVVVGWIALGIASNAYEKCLEYVKNRQQFGQPLAQFQIIQDRLVKMMGNIQAIALMCIRVSSLYEQSKLTLGQAGLLKAFASAKAREVVSLARECFGGNGILLDQGGIGRNFVDIEGVYTYEGTYDINTLVAGREITKLSAISSNNRNFNK
ncbi:hypothetical protein DICPUDRAFT_77698 [Dictyostelium purpureum]|uniref:Acyl-CoA oxidase n=1 Tax=Dictyostelium purpureum TaxID=5786 RepID=F0ZHD4_DICPU|nr:uncharacterized protein DICPUDRAFT_77698 [Dictyostelium purpureum]EGC36665.1 hypothetical protein DICPUDRAFT_77698 [Dictyostelium purpureum]|eukprot:XP_003286833.1 hypothetical protein DICPUDRAFT_77698 [Dictyostelium purpureum]